MITVRQLERLWQEKAFSRMSALLLEMRPESSVRLAQELARPTPIAALAIIRLDELAQAHSPFCSRMIRTILAAVVHPHDVQLAGTNLYRTRARFGLSKGGLDVLRRARLELDRQ